MGIWARKRAEEADLRDAQAAKIQAGIDHAAARQTKRAASQQAETLREINRRNHFSEGLARAMRGKPV